MLHYETVTPYLRNTLMRLMPDTTFDTFRFVGGTSLSLRLGHRMSIDIDLFSNAEYGDLDRAICGQCSPIVRATAGWCPAWVPLGLSATVVRMQ